MKTLFTCQYPFDPNAGAAGVTWRLGEEFRKLGHEVNYYSLNDLPDRLSPLQRYASFPAFVARHLHRQLQHHSIDVIDACTGDTWLWSTVLQKFHPRHCLNRHQKRPLLIARSHGLEHIQHLEFLEEAKRGNLHLDRKYFLYRGGIRLWESATAMRHADLVLLLNDRDRQYVIDRLGIHPDKTAIVANGISDSMLDLPFEPTPAIGEPLRIAQVSSYIVRKGIQYGTPALNTILQKYPHVEVSLFGTEVEADRVLEDFAPEVRDRVQVVAYYTNDSLPSLLEGHHIKFFPTISEGFGIALVEAMACGLAPVTTDTPGPLEIVQAEHDAIVVPSRDQASLEASLERLICDRNLLDTLRCNAYKTAQRFSWAHIAQENLRYYKKAQQQRIERSPRMI